MGSVFKDSAAVNSAPPPPPSSYIDEINGVEQVPVKNADGSITYITRALELSLEDQIKKDELDKMASDALEKIKRISSPDYIYSSSTQQVLDDWELSKLDTLEDSYDLRKETEADLLAKRGLSDSTAANTISRQTKQDEYDSKKQVNREKSAIVESMRANELSMQQNLYSLAQNQVNYDKAKTQQSINGNLSAVNAINSTNAASLNDYYNRKMVSSGNEGMFINNILDPLSQQAGDTSAGALDAGVDGFVKTITGGFL